MFVLGKSFICQVSPRYWGAFNNFSGLKKKKINKKHREIIR